MFRKKPPVISAPPIWLVVGLGNPGPEYSGTRHNLGFEVIDALASRAKVKLTTRQHRAVFGNALVGGESVLLVKPMTFMNLSGQAVAPLARAKGIKPERVLVLADELDLALGQLRLRAKGSAGGHNGHRSLIASLGTQEYPRIKLGVGKTDRSQTVDFVLGRFDPEERVLANEAVERACQIVELVVSAGLDRALSTYQQ